MKRVRVTSFALSAFGLAVATLLLLESKRVECEDRLEFRLDPPISDPGTYHLNVTGQKFAADCTVETRSQGLKCSYERLTGKWAKESLVVLLLPVRSLEADSWLSVNVQRAGAKARAQSLDVAKADRMVCVRHRFFD